MVDEDRGELVADGLVHERRRDGRVDAARQRRDDARVADLLLDALDLLGDDVAGVPVGGQARRLVEEVLDDLLAEVGVLLLGVPLHAVEALLGVAERGDRGRGGRGEHLEARGRLGHLVAVRHPHVLLERLPLEQHAARSDQRRIGGAVLAQTRVGDLAAEGLGHDLEAVADAERRDAQLEDLGVEARRALLVHRGRTTRQDDRDRVVRGDLGGRGRRRDQLAEDTGLAHTARDQLRVLGAEIDDQNGTLGGVGGDISCHWATSRLLSDAAAAAFFSAAAVSRSAR